MNILRYSSVIILFLLFSTLYAQEYKYSNSWGPAGFSLSRQNTAGMEINFSLQNTTLSDVNIDGVTMKSVNIPGVFLPNDAGKPDLAGTGRIIAIPSGAKVSYKIISYRTEKIKNIEIAPAPVLPLDSDPNPLKYNRDKSVYGKNSVYPESIVKISKPLQIRGIDAVIVGITPFQYNPVTKELTIYRDLKVQIDFLGGIGTYGAVNYRSRWWEPILSDVFLNYSSLPKFDENRINLDRAKGYGYEYVIICPNGSDFTAWADTLKRFRIAQGIKTGVFTLNDIGGNTVAGIKDWVTNAYNSWQIKPSAICLLADYGTDASSKIISILRTHPDSYPAYASDNYYADVNNDEIPDIVFSRIIANNATELQTLISKNINYEKNPPTASNFYSNPITALGWQTERWFQICSEVLGGFFKKSLGKNPVRINKVYSGTPGTVWSSATNTSTVINYFGPSGRYYIPQTPDSLGSWDGGTAAMINSAINSGAFLLQHRDHGMYTGWGEPSYTTSNLSSLTNTNLTFIYSINCETGAYHNPSGCPAEGSFVEVFYRYKYNNQNSGALGLVCPSEVSYSFVNDTYCWGMYDNMWPNFLPDYGTTPESRDLKPAFGMTAGKYFLQASSWPYNESDKEVTYRLFHMHGDAFLNLYSEVPQNLTVTIPASVLAGATSLDLSVNSGAFVSLTLDTTILATATGTGSTQTVNIPTTLKPTQQIKVVVTKQNYYRYEGTINVVAPTGPYVIYRSHAINDAFPSGNGNGLMDYGETNNLNLKVSNVGSAEANSVLVKLRTSNPYITITDSTENYGNINSLDSLLINNAFTYTVSGNIPDLTEVSFTVVASCGKEIWTSDFSVTAHSPILSYNGNYISDLSGNNNGRIDPGETVNLNIKIKNKGTSTARNIFGILSEDNSYITINTNNITYGNVNGLDSSINYFSITSSSSTPAGTRCQFTILFNSDLGLTASDTFSVYTPNSAYAPNPSTCLHPSHLKTNVYKPYPKLIWRKSTGYTATGYKIYLGTDSMPANILNGYSTGLDTFFFPTNLNFSTKYYWQVVPYNNDGDASNCPVRSFTTQANLSYGTGNAANGNYYYANSTPDASGSLTQPTYQWISDTATRITSWTSGTSDDGYFRVPDIGFNFTFFGNTYRTNNVNISSNGFISFGTSGSTSITPQIFPSTTAPNNVIAGAWRDLDCGVSDARIYYTSSSDKFVVTWWKACRYNYTSTYITFQIVLYPNGNIYINYNDQLTSTPLTNFITNSCCVGIENSSGSAGINYRYAVNDTNITGSQMFSSPLTVAFSSNGSSLPVQLTSFDYKVSGRDIALNWVTTAETNNSGFEIERCKVKSAYEWCKAGYIKGSGTTTDTRNYTFTDKNLSSGKFKYRLKQIDNNGNYNYYELNGIPEVGIPKKFSLLQNYPNPFNPNTKINYEIPIKSKVTIKIFDLLGREVSILLNEISEPGYYTIEFKANTLASGIYFYRMEAGNYSEVKKMLLIK